MKKLLYLLFAITLLGCGSIDDGNPCLYNPTFTTSVVTNITETSATLNSVISIVSQNCEDPINTEQGFVYATTAQSTTNNTQVNVSGTDISAVIENLEPNTTYYVRAFLTNTIGDFYGDEVSFTTNPLDTTPPIITIIGDNPLEINIGENYTELGATATDDIDGDITQDIIVDSSNLNTTLAGNYTVTYSVSDSSNNSTNEQREVTVLNDSASFSLVGTWVGTTTDSDDNSEGQVELMFNSDSNGAINIDWSQGQQEDIFADTFTWTSDDNQINIDYSDSDNGSEILYYSFVNQNTVEISGEGDDESMTLTRQ